MKVNQADVLSASLQNVSRSATDQSTRAARSNTTGSNALSSGDEVDLSTQALVSSALSAGEDVRSARVEELRQLYMNGQYTVDAQEVSRALIDAALSGM